MSWNIPVLRLRKANQVENVEVLLSLNLTKLLLPLNKNDQNGGQIIVRMKRFKPINLIFSKKNSYMVMTYPLFAEKIICKYLNGCFLFSESKVK